MFFLCRSCRTAHLQSDAVNPSHSDSIYSVFLELFVSKMNPETTDFFLFLFELTFKLDQLVIDSAMEKREMEHKHATIQQRVSFCFSLIDKKCI